ncbi:MAG TPA: FAD-linked oxidase C-terminal domain-containing protein [Pirellulales bacterium]|jgi:FAD/FMN-containing dehydrogenase/Fe-S oxidoreductase|nr:FAD-linked oxidase C-terminal domain-containing protein [Pirellulales bacterium]
MSMLTGPDKHPPIHPSINPDTQEHSYVEGDAGVDAAALTAALEKRIRGEVRFDVGSRALYATDGSNYRQVPIGVVIPRDADDAIETMRVCRQFGAPVLSRGGGTSLCGQCCNVAVILDFSKYMDRILELDPTVRRARVQPGVVLDTLRGAAEKHHLTFAPDPSTHTHCTLGGMIGNNSCGVHSVMGGKTDANVEALDVLLYDGARMTVGGTADEVEIDRIVRAGGRKGEIYGQLRDLRDKHADEIRRRFPQIPRRVSGYGLDYLLPEKGFDVAKALVGTEATCVMVLEATLRLVYSPPARSLLVLGYPSVYEAADHVMEVLEAGPVGLEGIDDRLVQDMIRSHIHPRNLKLLPDGDGWLLVEFGGEQKAESDAKAHALMARLKTLSNAPTMKLYDDPEVEKIIWKVRESGLGATAHVPGAKVAWEGWEDSAVGPEHLGQYLRDLRQLLDKYHYHGSLYGHFGQGCVHTRIDFDLVTREGIETFRSFLEEAADLVVAHGGSLSGEHGDGQSKAEMLPRMYGQEIVHAFEEFKSIWDPAWKMNPGKVVRPYRIDQNLRLGTHYDPPVVETIFQWPDDRFSWSQTQLRCVGIGECRKHEGGTMCPSYRVTHEEMHSTRGRARLLWEMLHGNPLTKGWRSEKVHEALDLCLACKGCKGDCPVNVDLATYKAEFLSHYYRGRLRPRHAYAMGLIYWWARIASRMPRVVNFVTQTPGLRDVAKWLGGIAPQREIPRFAEQTFSDWFRRRPIGNLAHPPVLLWPDTFNNHFFPEVLKSAVEVLEAAGFRIVVPQASLCCGRPLYDFGMLDQAKRQLRQILDVLKPQIEDGVPLVGMEPSCVAVFKDELGNLFPHDEDAVRLKNQAFGLAEFLEKRVPDFHVPHLDRQAIVHGHCHHKALVKMDLDKKLLDKTGLDYKVLDSGCCGLAGSFGFEASHYDVAQAVGDLVLLPAVRQADRSTLIVADGFSCREQIAHSTDRRAFHTAQVLEAALHEHDLPQDLPERGLETSAAPARLPVGVVVGVAALALGGWIWWRSAQRQRRSHDRYVSGGGSLMGGRR